MIWIKKRVGPCGTPLVYLLVMGNLQLYSVWPCLPERWLTSFFLKSAFRFALKIFRVERDRECIGRHQKSLMSIVASSVLFTGLGVLRPSSTVRLRYLEVCWLIHRLCTHVEGGKGSVKT